MLQTAGSAQGKVFVDATFGAGGHSAALLDAMRDSKVLAIDEDPASTQRAELMARRYPGRLTVQRGNFADIGELLDRAKIAYIDGILYDLGISSLQLAAVERGFSFAGNEPLDMRLDPELSKPTASDLLQSLSQTELESLLSEYGDERHSRAIARSIVRRRGRGKGPWMTGDLVAAVFSALPKRTTRARTRIHPATRTFQALRMAVNSDLESLQRSLRIVVQRLNPRGRIVAISFHSGEDRIVKREFKAFRDSGVAATLTRKPLRPSRAEIRANARSRSAKLRAAERRSDFLDHPGKAR